MKDIDSHHWIKLLNIENSPAPHVRLLLLAFSALSKLNFCQLPVQKGAITTNLVMLLAACA